MYQAVPSVTRYGGKLAPPSANKSCRIFAHGPILSPRVIETLIGEPSSPQPTHHPPLYPTNKQKKGRNPKRVTSYICGFIRYKNPNVRFSLPALVHTQHVSAKKVTTFSPDPSFSFFAPQRPHASQPTNKQTNSLEGSMKRLEQWSRVKFISVYSRKKNKF